MKKINMKAVAKFTFEDGCNQYIEYCRQRHLREGTIRHYKQSYLKFFEYFDPQLPIEKINVKSYNEFVLFLKSTLKNDISINSYLRDLITVFHFFMYEGYIPHFKMKSIKVDKSHIETYSEEELRALLKKPNIKKCSFSEYKAWVVTSFLFATGVRQRSLINIKIKDLDFENNVVYVNVTKNRKTLIVPMNQTLVCILSEYLKYRHHKSDDEYLFCNIFGNQLVKSTCYGMLYTYNKSRGVETTGVHRYRHTFAKQWILSGGDVVSLSKLLGHSSLEITQNYIHLLVSEVAEKVKQINVFDKFTERTHISFSKS